MRREETRTAFINCYEDAARAEAYAQLEFANTYYLAYRDLAIARVPVTCLRMMTSVAAQAVRPGSCGNLASMQPAWILHGR